MMNRPAPRATAFLLSSVLSLVAIFIATTSFSALIEEKAADGDEQLALLYKIAARDIPRLSQSTSSRSVFADLSTMQLTLKDGENVVADFPILSIGRPGTFWETPTGNYSVKSKEASHFSSIGNVWMPYSMQFFGNYFIHGWPYDSEGKPVRAGYSGGCIRLSTENAATVFAFVEEGTPIIIRGERDAPMATSTFRYFLKEEGRPDEISAQAFLVADIETGQVLWEKGGDQVLPMENLSALMVGSVALETVNQYKSVRMSELLLGTPIPRKVSGMFEDELPIGALIYPLLFESNETAAKAFASDHGERAFVRAMNEKAKAIGMTQTMFASTTINERNTTTVNDQFRLVRHVAESKNFLFNVMLQPLHQIFDPSGDVERFSWKNELLNVASSTQYRGGLTRATGSGSGIMLYSLPLEEFGDRKIVFVVLDSERPLEDVEHMKKFILEKFVYAPDVVGLSQVKVEQDDPIPSLWGKLRSLWVTNWLILES